MRAVERGDDQVPVAAGCVNVFTQASLGENVDLPLDADHVLVELQDLSDDAPCSAVEHAAQVHRDRLEAIANPSTLGIDVGDEDGGPAGLLVVLEDPDRKAVAPIPYHHRRGERARSAVAHRAHDRIALAAAVDLLELVGVLGG